MSTPFKIILTIVALGIAGLVVWLKASERKNSDYETTKLKKIHLTNNRLISGTISPVKEIEIVSHISGVIDEIFIKEGQLIHVGDPIARIKIIASPEAVENATKNQKLAQLNREWQTNEFNRQKKLFDSGVIPKSDYEAIRSKWLQSEEEYQSAVKQLEIIRQGYSKSDKKMDDVIRSTVNGTVLEIPLEIGASVVERNNFNEGTGIAIIADMTQLVFKGKISENDVWILDNVDGFSVKIPVLKDVSLQAKLEKTAIKGTEENGIVHFDFQGVILPQKGQAFPARAGYSGIAEFVIEEAKNALAIEEKNILYANDSSFVEIVQNKKKKRVSILTGVCDGIHCEVKKGIQPTDKIVIQEN